MVRVLVKARFPGLLGHGPQIPDRTIDHCKATDLCPKFQLSRCYSGREIGDRWTDGRTDGRTDDTTISVEPIFLKMCSKNQQKLRCLLIVWVFCFPQNLKNCFPWNKSSTL
jgi:hypothetical protein